MHQRQQIRQTVCNKLKNNTIANDRVFAMRKLPLFESELPCILVYATSENASKFNEAPRELERKLQLSITGILQAPESEILPEKRLDNALDSFALSIETILNNNRYLDDCASDSILTNTEIAIDTDGIMPAASIILNYDITYYTEACSQKPLPDLKEITINYKSENVTVNDALQFPEWLKLK